MKAIIRMLTDKKLYLSHMVRYLVAFSSVLFLSACIFHKKDAKTNKVKQTKLTYGMTHEEALAAITDRSEIVVGEFNYAQGHLVAYQYTRYGKAGLKEPKFYLYFLNDTLFRKSAPEDLKKGARLALRDRREYYADLAEQEELREISRVNEEARQKEREEKRVKSLNRRSRASEENETEEKDATQREKHSKGRKHKRRQVKDSVEE
jgi:hypothetical protein